MRFADQVVWITGASSGIGEAMAREFAREGARLVLSSRRTAELERVRLGCERPDHHRVLPFDLADTTSFADLARSVISGAAGVDVLVNNGGVGQRALAVDTDEPVERAIMEVNYFAPVALSKAVLPSMLSRGRGQIVVVSSVMGYVGTPGRSSYAAAKHALHGYFDSLRAEVASRGIAITLICPGYVRTQISLNALGPRGEPHGRVDPKTARGITPERCARGIVRAAARRQREAYIGGWEVAGIFLQRFVPGLFARIVRRMKFSVADQP